MNTPPYISFVTDFDSYVAGTPKHNGVLGGFGNAFSDALANFVIYDLGAVRNVCSLLFWNYHFAGSAGVSLMDVIGSTAFTTNTENINFGFGVVSMSVPTFSDPVTLLSNQAVLDAPGLSMSEVNAQVFPFSCSAVRFIQLKILDNHFGSSDTSFAWGQVAFELFVPSMNGEE